MHAPRTRIGVSGSPSPGLNGAAGDFITGQFVAFANGFDHQAVIARAKAAH
jgi:hypothetical protein